MSTNHVTILDLSSQRQTDRRKQIFKVLRIQISHLYKEISHLCRVPLAPAVKPFLEATLKLSIV